MSEESNHPEIDQFKALQEMLAGVKDKERLAKLIAGIESKRPSRWSHSSNAVYYKERHALWFKAALDAMMAESEIGKFENRVYRYDRYPDLTPGSLYIKVNQAKLYLLEKLDPDHRYARFCELIKIDRKRNYGIILAYQMDVINGVTEALPVPVSSIKIETEPSIKDKVDDFCDKSKPGDELKITSVDITPELQELLENSLSQLSNLLYKIDKSSITILHLTEEQAAKLNE